MKLTKQRLKEIIREELGSVEEGVFTSRMRQQTAQTNLASVQKAEKLVKQLVDEFNNAGSNEEKKEIQGRIQGLLKAVSRIQEVRAPFPTGSRVRHEEYGEGVVTHAGTKNTNVAVKFDKETANGKKNRQVSRGSLKRAK